MRLSLLKRKGRTVGHGDLHPADGTSLLDPTPVLQAPLVKDVLNRTPQLIDRLVLCNILIANTAISIHVHDVLHGRIFNRDVYMGSLGYSAAAVVKDNAHAD